MSDAPARGGSAREALLDDVVAYAVANGVGNVSLRTLASAIGSSHRMLLYHFGSREGLLAAIVDRMEREQRSVLDHLAAKAVAGTAAGGTNNTGTRANVVDPGDVVRQQWHGLADPAMHEAERLFFEVVALAMRDHPGTGALKASLVGPWLDQGEAAAAALGLPASTARVDARIGVAFLRGLLLDLLVTGDRDGTDACVDRFLSLWSGAPAGRPGERTSGPARGGRVGA